ncbi:helix-turn-helix domain-containing protein [Ruania zhangjianzhongii]|uniref:helix-turn-helix domain-containing protein n=1 Tax=Ruania zhangjianzhongii TaxID=2603206 RepID=UPI0011C8FA2E|nr:helix-turn-helix domain-containing protein [Ruania zhangjianzhongii]
MTQPTEVRENPIAVTERSGVLFPDRLARYAAGWIAPEAAVSAVVDHYWHVSWALDDGESLDQPIIDLPAVTVTIEEGDAPAPLVVTGVHARAWRRTISGTGRVFAIRLRPAGLAVLSDLTPERVADATVPLTAELDERLHTLMVAVGTETDPIERARVAGRAIRERLAERPPTATGLLAGEVVDELRERVRRRTGPALAERFACSERTIQRALTESLGHGPKWISRRIRLQEVALALATRPIDDLAAIATELGYSDQSHLTRDFRTTTGLTPDAYRHAVGSLAASSRDAPAVTPPRTQR